jgi:hypothetical protein
MSNVSNVNTGGGPYVEGNVITIYASNSEAVGKRDKIREYLGSVQSLLNLNKKLFALSSSIALVFSVYLDSTDQSLKDHLIPTAQHDISRFVSEACTIVETHRSLSPELRRCLDQVSASLPDLRLDDVTSDSSQQFNLIRSQIIALQSQLGYEMPTLIRSVSDLLKDFQKAAAAEPSQKLSATLLTRRCQELLERLDTWVAMRNNLALVILNRSLESARDLLTQSHAAQWIEKMDERDSTQQVNSQHIYGTAVSSYIAASLVLRQYCDRLLKEIDFKG